MYWSTKFAAGSSVYRGVSKTETAMQRHGLANAARDDAGVYFRVPGPAYRYVDLILPSGDLPEHDRAFILVKQANLTRAVHRSKMACNTKFAGAGIRVADIMAAKTLIKAEHNVAERQ